MNRRQLLTRSSSLLLGLGVSGCLGSDSSETGDSTTTGTTATPTATTTSGPITETASNYDEEDGDDENIKVYSRDGEVETLSEEESDELRRKVMENVRNRRESGDGGSADCSDYNLDGDCDGDDGVDGDEG